MGNSKVLNAAKANFGAKGWAVVVYLFICFYLNTSINTCWQNIVPYWQESFGWETATMMSLVSVAQFIGIAVCFILGRVVTRSPPRRWALWWASSPPAACSSFPL